MSGQEAEGWPNGLCLGPEQVVPIVFVKRYQSDNLTIAFDYLTI
jgi:hypothetical protein